MRWLNAWFICCMPQTAWQCCQPFSKTHLPCYPIVWGLALYDEQNSVTLSDRHSFKMFHWTILSLLFPPPSSLVGNPSRLLNRTEFRLFRYGNPPSNPLLAIHTAELSDNSTLFKGAWEKWHKNGVIAIKLIHQTWKALKRDMGDRVKVFGREDTGEGKWWDNMCL